MTLDEFLATYGGERVVLDITVEPTTEGTFSPFIILRHGDFTFVLNPMALGDHLCVDAHGFVAGEKARTGTFGMERGSRVSFAASEVNGKSHGWPATQLVTLLLGDQKETS